MKRWVIRKRRGTWWARGPHGLMAFGVTWRDVCREVQRLERVVEESGWDR
jgi:hypothetical protein